MRSSSTRFVIARRKQAQCVLARVGDRHGVAARLQVHADQFLNRRIVVNRENSIHLLPHLQCVSVKRSARSMAATNLAALNGFTNTSTTVGY